MQITSITQLTQLSLSQLDLDKDDTIELNGQKYNIRLNDQIDVSKDYGQKNCFQKACQNISDFFERMNTQDQITCTPRASQIQTILQQKVANQALNIANITTGTAFLSALEQYQGDLIPEDAIAFKQAYRNIQLNHKGDNELYGIALVATAFNNGHFSEKQYHRLCELTHVASAHGKLSHELKDATELSQTDFISLQGLAADSIAIQRVALQFSAEPLALINTIGHFKTKDDRREFDKSDMGKQIINESCHLKKTNEKICNKLAWEALEKR